MVGVSIGSYTTVILAMLVNYEKYPALSLTVMLREAGIDTPEREKVFVVLGETIDKLGEAHAGSVAETAKTTDVSSMRLIQNRLRAFSGNHDRVNGATIKAPKLLTISGSYKPKGHGGRPFNVYKFTKKGLSLWEEIKKGI